MSFGLCYWVLMLIWFVFGIWTAWPAQPKQIGGTVLMFILLVLLGWKTFGAPIHS